MAKITHIAIHHSGGTQSNPLASTKGVTFESINAYHKQRWNFPSRFIPNQFGGYNFAYSPVTRSWHQFRAIGEETAAQIGWNLNTIPICILGNYTKGGADKMTKQIEEDIAMFILKLIDNPRGQGFVIAPNTEIDLSISRVQPHRWFNPGHTECYGSALSNSWIAGILAKYKLEKHEGLVVDGGRVSRDTTIETLKERISLLQQILKLMLAIHSFASRKSDRIEIGAAHPNLGYACTGNIN